MTSIFRLSSNVRLHIFILSREEKKKRRREKKKTKTNRTQTQKTTLLLIEKKRWLFVWPRSKWVQQKTCISSSNANKMLIMLWVYSHRIGKQVVDLYVRRTELSSNSVHSNDKFALVFEWKFLRKKINSNTSIHSGANTMTICKNVRQLYVARRNISGAQ